MKKIFGIFLLILIIFSGCVQQNSNAANDQNVQGGKNVLSEIIENGDTIKVEYKAFVGNDMVDSSEKAGKPLEFKVGAGQMIKGFDSAVLGHRLNDEFEVTVSPDKAYGNKDPQLIVEVPKEKLQGADTVQKGMVLTSADKQYSGIVVEVKDTTIKVDFNHPLAGKTMKFWIKIVGLEKK
ncbi:MAG: peptidylprolyl isomerase [Candidatus Diapherotrites archaeon CG08_land_8_20_14_0_20_34_12]|nr:MAG: peptidylprolyl isomerase [Candidatus Diapherotrites archaeon CG08_land_8_20_14_0_20_34_12]